MRILHVALETTQLDFTAARELADREARAVLADPICLSWFDRALGRESPAHVSECRDECDVPGYEEYAASRGGTLKVVVAGGSYVFCYRPLGEFA